MFAGALAAVAETASLSFAAERSVSPPPQAQRQKHAKETELTIPN
jgi:Spy/CpxP family protein refolding chaperone